MSQQTGATAVVEPVADTSRVLTVPNALSALRLLGVPLFLWLVLGPEADGWAIGVLMASGFTDYLDGKIARRYNLMSRVGELLDPLADRLYILAALAALTARGIIPLALTVVLVARDAVLTGSVLVLRRHGFGPLPVHFLGKAATANLLYALPLLLLGDASGTLGDVVRPIAWGFAGWGAALYIWAGLLYLWQAATVITADRRRTA